MRYVFEVEMSTDARKKFKLHLSSCPTCKRGVKHWREAKKEDSEVCERVRSLSFSELGVQLNRAIIQGDAALASPIVERLFTALKEGNQSALSLLQKAAKLAPGMARSRALAHLETIRNKSIA
jgi:anti-sigma factor RsiW